MSNDMVLRILEFVILVIVGLVARYLIPYLKTKVTTTQQTEILEIVNIAVKAAEQTLNGGKVKKADVVSFVSKYLDERGIKISEEQLDKLIEAAVFAMNNPDNKIEVVTNISPEPEN